MSAMSVCLYVWVSWGHLDVWGELASHNQPTTPVLKAGHPGVPCYIFIWVMVGWVTFLR